VIQKIAIGGTHSGGPFRRPYSGAMSCLHTTPGVPLRFTPSCSSAPLHCRLYSAAPPALFSIRPGIQRRRRAGLKPEAKPCGAPGNREIQFSKPLTRGGGERGRISSPQN
jgi:hypothetical protein